MYSFHILQSFVLVASVVAMQMGRNANGKVPPTPPTEPSDAMDMAPRWHKKTKTRAIEKNKQNFLKKCQKVNRCFLGHFEGPGEHGIMREPLEMITDSRMQNMVEIREKNTYFVTILLFQNV